MSPCGLVFRFLILFAITVASLLGAPLRAASAAERPAVTAVRVADHNGTTRFVLDLTGPVGFTANAEVEPARVVVDLPDLDWQSKMKSLWRPVGVLRNFSFADAAGAGHLLLETVQPATVKKAFLIRPTDGSIYRLVLDLVPAPADRTQHLSANPILSAAPVAPATAMRAGDVAGSPLPIRQPQMPPAAVPIPASLPLSAPAENPGRPAGRKGGHAGKPIVVIDPGHGGVDPGATSLTGAYEKNIVLALAREVKAQLGKRGKVTCVLTRDRDVFIALRDRVAIGRAANADLFMSLHADTVADPDIRGLSVYTLSQTASDAEAQALADKENKADIVAGIDLSNESPEVTNILIDLVQRESMNLSAVFAHYVIQEVSRETHELLQNTHRFAGFAVLKAPDVPSVLVETGYLSNQRDEQMLRQPEYRAKLANALARAIERYFARTQKARRS